MIFSAPRGKVFGAALGPILAALTVGAAAASRWQLEIGLGAAAGFGAGTLGWALWWPWWPPKNPALQLSAALGLSAVRLFASLILGGIVANWAAVGRSGPLWVAVVGAHVLTLVMDVVWLASDRPAEFPRKADQDAAG